MSILSLASQPYISLRTWRRSGEAMDTPVWVVGDGDALYVYTRHEAGKAKRARNNSAVEIARCDMRGAVKSDWLPARAQVDNTPETLAKVLPLLRKKYGIQFRLLWWTSGAEKTPRTILILKDRA